MSYWVLLVTNHIILKSCTKKVSANPRMEKETVCRDNQWAAIFEVMHKYIWVYRKVDVAIN